MIVVAGWPRSGTSLLMQVLAAGGLTPYVGTYGLRPTDSNKQGVWELPGAMVEPTRVAGPLLRFPNACIKLMHRGLTELLDAGQHPSAVVMTDRDPAAVLESRARLWPNGGGMTAAALDVVRARSRDALRRERVPWLEVAVDELVVDPRPVCEAVAAFVRPYTTFDLDVEAMAAAPDPEQLTRL